MPAKRSAAATFSAEEKAAARERVKELRQQQDAAAGEAAVREKIAEMVPADRVVAERIHAIVKQVAPSLTSRTWYGMPAYVQGDDVVCFFQPSQKFKVRYSTFGFSDKAKLDEGNLWPNSYAVTKLTPADEAKIAALIKRAVG